MPIDRIGKGAPPIPSPEVQGKSAVDKPFVVDAPPKAGVEQLDPAATVVGTKATATKDLTAIGAASPLARLKAGEIDVRQYVDLKVDEATRGLSGLSSSQLHEVKKVLKDQMATDPGLSDLVHTATGRAPTPPEDD